MDPDFQGAWASLARNWLAMDFAYSLLGRRDVELLAEQLKRLGVTKVVDPMAGTGLCDPHRLCSNRILEARPAVGGVWPGRGVPGRCARAAVLVSRAAAGRGRKRRRGVPKLAAAQQRSLGKPGGRGGFDPGGGSGRLAWQQGFPPGAGAVGAAVSASHRLLAAPARRPAHPPEKARAVPLGASRGLGSPAGAVGRRGRRGLRCRRRARTRRRLSVAPGLSPDVLQNLLQEQHRDLPEPPAPSKVANGAPLVISVAEALAPAEPKDLRTTVMLRNLPNNYTPPT